LLAFLAHFVEPPVAYAIPQVETPPALSQITAPSQAGSAALPLDEIYNPINLDDDLLGDDGRVCAACTIKNFNPAAREG